MLLILAPSLAGAASPTLQLGGACPGVATLDATRLTPGGTVAILSADGTGNAPLPGGPCPGNTGLSQAGLKLRKLVTADAAGEVHLSPTLPGGVCGSWVQVVDAASCLLSPARQLPGGPDCTFVPDPADSQGEPQAMAGVTAAHNAWRARVGTAPVHWNTTLAASAQDWADQCVFGHDPNRSPDAGYSYVGENMYFRSPSGNGLQAVEAWASERVDYDFGTPIDYQNYQIFGHYTQLVWDDTEAIGCGISDCMQEIGWWVIVCRYGPGGNYIGRTPYDYVADACVDLDNDDVFQWEDADDTDRRVR